MNEKVAAYVRNALSRGVERHVIVDKLKSIGFVDEEIGEAFAAAGNQAATAEEKVSADVVKSRRQVVDERIAVARGHSGDMFGAGSKKNAEEFASGAPAYFMLSQSMIGVIVGLVFLGLVVALRLSWAIMAVPLLIFVFELWYGRAYLRDFLFTLDEGCLFFRKGVFTHAYTLLPYENIQDIHVVQGIMDRLFGVTTVIIFTATTSGAGSESVPGLRREGAEKLRANLFRRMKEAKNVTD